MFGLARINATIIGSKDAKDEGDDHEGDEGEKVEEKEARDEKPTEEPAVEGVPQATVAEQVEGTETAAS